MDLLKKCTLCPRNCSVNRHLVPGKCGATDQIKVAYYHLHQWEEPIISGIHGSGTVFFSHCNLKCIFCQNKKISTNGYGKEISEEQLETIFLKLQEQGAHNINLVTPTHYISQIVSILQKVKDKELTIPIIYNTSSYENKKSIHLLDSLIDIYLADLKYYDPLLGEKFSNCKNYFLHATQAISEMYHQVGTPQIKDSLLVRGLVVRVLILPGYIDDAKKILHYLYDTYGDNIYISIMNQYTPVSVIDNYPSLNRKLTSKEYDEVIHYACDLGITNAFIQEGDTASQSFIPDFDCSIL